MQRSRRGFSLVDLDYFVKLDSSYRSFTPGGALFTLLLAYLWIHLAYNEYQTYRQPRRIITFGMDDSIQAKVPLNLDLTIAMDCDDLHVSVREGSQSSIDMDSSFHKQRVKYGFPEPPPRDSSGLLGSPRRYNLPRPPVPDNAGKHCRIRGRREFNKLKTQVRITPTGFLFPGLGIPQERMNFTHTINAFNFGRWFPGRQAPLDGLRSIARDGATEFIYFMKVVPTLYKSRRGFTNKTYQFAVTGTKRAQSQAYPSLVFAYEPDVFALRIEEKYGTLTRLMYRLLSVLCGFSVTVGLVYSGLASLVTFLASRRGSKSKSTFKLVDNRAELGTWRAPEPDQGPNRYQPAHHTLTTRPLVSPAGSGSPSTIPRTWSTGVSLGPPSRSPYSPSPSLYSDAGSPRPQVCAPFASPLPADGMVRSSSGGYPNTIVDAGRQSPYPPQSR